MEVVAEHIARIDECNKTKFNDHIVSGNKITQQPRESHMHMKSVC